MRVIFRQYEWDSLAEEIRKEMRPFMEYNVEKQAHEVHMDFEDMVRLVRAIRLIGDDESEQIQPTTPAVINENW